MKKLCFKYHDVCILLSEYDEIDDTNKTKNELKQKLKNLNLKYSFYQLFRLSENELKKLDFSIVYMGKEIPINKFVSEYNDFADSLNEIPDDFVKRNNIDYLVSQSFASKSQNHIDGIIIIETCRLFYNLYNTFCAARHNLLEAKHILQPSSVAMWKNGEDFQFWIRSLYLNNAILWYNSCFDLILQCFWIGKNLFSKYQRMKKPLDKYTVEDLKSNESREEIFRICTLEKIGSLLKGEKYEEYINGRDNQVAVWANKLKHQNGLFYSEIYHECGTYRFETIGYDSSETLTTIGFEEVINELKEYNNKLVELITDAQKDILSDFI